MFRAILSIYIVYALLAKGKNAIYWCLVLPAMNILASLMVVIVALINLDVTTALREQLPTLIVNSAWIVYFVRSEYIQRTYKPREYNYRKDKYILMSVFVVLLILSVLGVILK